MGFGVVSVVALKKQKWMEAGPAILCLSLAAHENKLSAMPQSSKRLGKRIELGEYVVADPAICDGVPTFKGTRIMVWQVLDALGRGESWNDIVKAWAGRVTKPAIAETIRLAHQALLDEKGQLLRSANRGLAA